MYFFFTYHGGIDVRSVQLHVDHFVDGCLALAVVVLAHLRLHFSWGFSEFVLLTKRYKNIALQRLFFGSVQVKRVCEESGMLADLNKRDERRSSVQTLLKQELLKVSFPI